MSKMTKLLCTKNDMATKRMFLGSHKLISDFDTESLRVSQ